LLLVCLKQNADLCDDTLVMRLATNLVKAVNHIAKGWKTSQMKTLTSALLLSSRNVCFYLTNQQPEYKRLVGRSGRAAGR